MATQPFPPSGFFGSVVYAGSGLSRRLAAYGEGACGLYATLKAPLESSRAEELVLSSFCGWAFSRLRSPASSALYGLGEGLPQLSPGCG